MTGTTLAAALDQLGQADEPGPPRCGEMTRADSGAWARCRRDADGHQRHHIRGRSWETGGNMPRLDLGFTCTADGCCRWPQQEVPYFGATAKGSAAAAAGLASARQRPGGITGAAPPPR